MRGRLVLLSVLGGLGCLPLASQLETRLLPVASVVDAGTPEPPPQVTVTGCWSAPIVIAPSSSWAVGSMVVLPSGDALVAWQENAVRPRILARYVFLDGGLSIPEVLYAAPEAPFLVENIDGLALRNSRGSGDVVLSFVHRGDAGAVNEVLMSTLHLDAGWGPIVRLNSDLSTRIIWADVRPDSQGRYFASWSQPPPPGEPAGLHFRRSSPDGGWSSEAIVTPARTVLTATPSLHVSADGRAVLAWQGYFAPTYEPELHATLLDAVPWVDTRLDVLGNTSTQYAVALAPDGGDAFAVWNGGGSIVEARFSRLRAGTWTAPEQFKPGLVMSASAAAFDDLGRVTVQWTEWMTPQVLIRSSREDDAGWAAPLLLDSVEETRFLAHATNGRRSLTAWGRGSSLMVNRTEDDGTVLDALEGLIVRDSRAPPAVFVGESGARWILANVSESGWRAVAFVCR